MVPGEAQLKSLPPTIILRVSRKICTIYLMEPSAANGIYLVLSADVIGLSDRTSDGT